MPFFDIIELTLKVNHRGDIMINIFYYKNTAGTLVAKWPGSGKRVDGQSRKQGQFYLGKVINKEKNIFYKKGEGYYIFNPEDMSKTPVAMEDLPSYSGPLDKRERKQSCMCSFGGVYFLSRFIPGIEYNKVLDSLKYKNSDTFYTVLMSYLLTPSADMHTEYWYKMSYAQYLYPKANVASQRISDFYKAIGSDDNRRVFLTEHIKYINKVIDNKYCVLVDSTGCPNACDIPITKISRHENDINIEFRLIAVVHKTTGIPIYYEIIPGNIVDISTVDNIIKKLKLLGCEVEYVIGDAGYCCPGVMERLILNGIDFMTRMNPAYNNYKEVVLNNIDKLKDNTDNTVRYHDRLVKIIKVESVIGKDKKTNEDKTGFIYLCRDMESYHGKSSHLMTSKKAKSMTSLEIENACNKFGVFAIVSTKELEVDEVLPEYYIRQGVEQLFDYAKNNGKLLPVRNHTVETIKGHILMSFIATFISIVIKNKLNILDTRYAAVPAYLREKISEDEETIEIETDNDIKHLVIVQDQLESVMKTSPSMLFEYLNLQSAEIFDTEIVPSVATKEAKSFFEAFGLNYPVTIMRENGTLVPVLKEGVNDKISQVKVFSYKPAFSDEEIEKLRRKKEDKILAQIVTEAGADKIKTIQEEQSKKEEKRGPGRPPGRKNNKTLEKEAELKRLEESGLLPEKRKRGRPPKLESEKAKNKKRKRRKSRSTNKSKSKK